MTEQNTPSSGDELKKLMEENLALTKELLQLTKKVKNYILWQQVFGFIKLLIIAVPIVLGLIYLPPLIVKAYENYQQLLNFKSSATDLNNLNLKDLPLPKFLTK